MNNDNIHKAFADLIAKRNIHKELGITSGYVRTLRHKLATVINISLETKLKLLQKSGWQQTDVQYSKKALVSLLNFYKTTSKAARDQGPEYVIEKWEAEMKGSQLKLTFSYRNIF